MKKVISLVLAFAMCLSLCACGKADAYESAVALMEAGNYEEAVAAFTELGDYEDSAQKLEECENILAYAEAVALFEAEQYEDALAIFTTLGNYQDSLEKKLECENALAYQAALELIASGNYENAYTALVDLGEYKDVPELLSHFKEVEITTKNWSNYFSITIVPEYTKNDFDEITYLDLNFTLDLNEDIASSIFNPKESNVIFEFSFTSIRKDVQYDTVSGEYEILPPVHMVDELLNSTATLTWEAQSSLKPIIEDAGLWMSPPAEAGLPVDGYQYMLLAEEFNATRTQGSIFIYE